MMTPARREPPPEQRNHWAEQHKTFIAVVGGMIVIIATLVGIGQWVGAIDTRVVQLTTALDQRRATIDTQLGRMQGSIEALRSDLGADRVAAGRVDERLKRMEDELRTATAANREAWTRALHLLERDAPPQPRIRSDRQ